MPDIVANCTSCGQEFAIIPMEQDILKKLKLPDPQQCYFCRKKQRHHVRMRGRFYKVNCKKCNQEIYTTCDPETGLIIYCKDCYLAYKASGESEKVFLNLE